MGLSGLDVFLVLLRLVNAQADVVIYPDDRAVGQLRRYALAHPAGATVMHGISDAGTTPVYAAVVMLLGWPLIRHGRWRWALGAIVILAGSTSLNRVVKTAVSRPRPRFLDPAATASGLSFFSGHAQSAVVAITVIGFLLRPRLCRRWKWPGVVFAGA